MSRETIGFIMYRELPDDDKPFMETHALSFMPVDDTESDESHKAVNGWQESDFDDSGWGSADSLGGIESSMEFFQWNGDGGMYAWPGYDGISPFLAKFELAPVGLLHVY